MEKKFIPYQSVRKLQGSRALVLAPHPDDEVFGCAGAIMHHVAAGEFVAVHILTDGAFGAAPNMRNSIDEIRKQESLAAALILGYGKPQFWGLPDRGLHYCETLILQIQNTIASSQADLVYAPSVFEIHPDHRAVALATIEAVRRNGSAISIAMYEVGVPMVHPNVLLDISDLATTKANAMACFSSQLQGQAYDQQIAALNRFRTYTLNPQVTSAEAYFTCSSDELHGSGHALFGGLYDSAMAPSATLLLEGNPLVSVLIRSMDREYLDEAIHSLTLQTYVNIEVVVVNARTEEHRELGDRCGRYPLRLIQTGSSMSRSAAANCALENARGEYFVFLDDDDWIDPAHISLLVTAMQEHPKNWVAYCGTELRNFKREPVDFELMNAPFDAGRLRSGNYIPLNSLLFSKEVLINGVRFDLGFDVYEDWDFLLQTAQWTQFTHVNQIAAFYRATGSSGVGLLGDDSKKLLARTQIFEKWKHLWTGAQLQEMVTALSAQTLEAISKSQVKHEELQKTKNMVQAQHEEMDQQQAKNNALIHDLNDQIQDLKVQLLQKDGQLYDLITSTSWKLGRPMRFVGRNLRLTKQIARKSIRRILGVSSWPGGNPVISQGFAGELLQQPDQVDFMPLISIILPVYNACRTDKKFFWNALKSIEGQTYKNIELIVVDDGSTDDSRALYDEFMLAHPGLHAKYVTKLNAGQSSARNLGVQVCKGDYVSFIDQDDEWYEDRLKRVVPWLSNNEIDLIYTDADNIDADGQVTYKSIHKTYCFGWPHPKKQIEDILFKDIIVMPGLMVIKKEKYEAVGGFDVNLSGYEDDDLFLRIFEIGRIFYLPEPTLRWRMYGDNYSFSSRMLKSRLYYWKKLLKNYTNDGRDTFRSHMISMRFFQEFLTQSLAQFQSGSELYRHSMDGAKEIIPHLPLFPRLIFSIGFALPKKFNLTAMVKISRFFRSG